MNEEVEIKVVVKNPEEVEKKLHEMAEFKKERTQVDEYFTPKHEDFFALKRPLKYLRIRNEGDRHTFEYQFLHFEGSELIKTDEYETEIKDPEMMRQILEHLDMTHKVTVTKNRKYFHYKDFEVQIDFIKELGYFIEVEALKLLGDYKETKKKCYEIF